MPTLPGLVKDAFPPATDTQVSPISIPDGTTLITTRQHNKIIDIISGDDTSKIPNSALDDIAQSKVTNLTTDLASKAPVTHTHPQSEITNLVTDLSNKSAVGHTHAAVDITSGIFPIARLAIGTPDGTKFVDDTGTLRTPPTGGASDHGVLTGLGDDDHTQYQLRTERNAINGYAGLDGSSKLTGSQQVYGSAADTACVGNDSRLSDARTPLAHTHLSSDITNFTAAVSSNAAVALNTAKVTYPSVDSTKLAGIETAAAADQTDSEIQTAYNNLVSIVSQAEAEAGISTIVRRWTAQRVAQAIAALAPGGGGGSANYQIFSQLNDTPSASATEYYSLNGPTTGNGAEAQRRGVIGQDVTVTSMTAICRTNNKTSAFDMHLRDDSVDVISVNILAGSTAQSTQITTASIAGGSEWAYRYDPGTDTGNTITLKSVSIQLSDD